MTRNIIALIPARGGSKRVPRKNIRPLAGHPLLAYAIATAHEAGIFSRVVVSTDDAEIAAVVQDYGAEPLMCSLDIAHRDYNPDIRWVRHALEAVGGDSTAFAILRPTSPFRRGEWVARAAERFFASTGNADSLRAMRPVSEHPGKMWILPPHHSFATPLLPFSGTEAPWHSMPSQELPTVLVQTASLEIAHRYVVNWTNTISGETVLAWVIGQSDPEAIDINTEADWDRAEDAARWHPEWLPNISVSKLNVPAMAGGR